MLPAHVPLSLHHIPTAHSSTRDTVRTTSEGKHLQRQGVSLRNAMLLNVAEAQATGRNPGQCVEKAGTGSFERMNCQRPRTFMPSPWAGGTRSCRIDTASAPLAAVDPQPHYCTASPEDTVKKRRLDISKKHVNASETAEKQILCILAATAPIISLLLTSCWRCEGEIAAIRQKKCSEGRCNCLSRDGGGAGSASVRRIYQEIYSTPSWLVLFAQPSSLLSMLCLI